MSVGHQQHAAYYTIMFGKIVRNVKERTETSKSRINKNGKTVHEEHYDFIDGTIDAIETKDSDFGKMWIITLMDGEDRQILQMNYSGGYSQAFLKCLPNVDLGASVKIIPKESDVVNKAGKTVKKTTVFITQHGKPIKWFWNKENPGELPELESKKIKNKIVWDDSEVMEFLENMVKTDIVPNLKGQPKTAADATAVNPDTQPQDDLPF